MKTGSTYELRSCGGAGRSTASSRAGAPYPPGADECAEVTRRSTAADKVERLAFSSGGRFFLWCLAPKACLSSFSCSSVRLERTSVAFVPSTAARNLSSVIWSMSRNQPALPGGTASPICSSTCLSMPVLAPLPNRAPRPAPIARPRNGHEEEQAEEHAPEGAAHGARADQAVAVLDVRLAVGVAHDLGGVLQLDDHVLLHLRELDAEAVGLELVLEAEDHHFAHIVFLSVPCTGRYPVLGRPGLRQLYLHGRVTSM